MAHLNFEMKRLIPLDAQRDVLSPQGASLARSMPTLFLGKDQK